MDVQVNSYHLNALTQVHAQSADKFTAMLEIDKFQINSYTIVIVCN